MHTSPMILLATGFSFFFLGVLTSGVEPIDLDALCFADSVKSFANSTWKMKQICWLIIADTKGFYSL